MFQGNVQASLILWPGLVVRVIAINDYCRKPFCSSHYYHICIYPIIKKTLHKRELLSYFQYKGVSHARQIYVEKIRAFQVGCIEEEGNNDSR